MAARSVLKLVTKTCACSLHPTRRSAVSTEARKIHVRSYSQPPKCNPLGSPREHFYQMRTVSRSLQNFRDQGHKDEDYEQEYEVEEKNYNVFPTAVDMSIREPAKEFREVAPPEEVNDDGNPIYELSEGSRSDQNFFDVLDFMRRKTYADENTLFVHLQPNNVKPYGSSENMCLPPMRSKKIKIVYPVVNTSGGNISKKKIDEQQRQEFSSYRLQKEYPGYETRTKVAVCDTNCQESRFRFSTASSKKRSQSLELQKPKLSFTRRSSTALLERSKESSKNQKVSEQRKYNTEKTQKSKDECEDYVTVKLGELKEECRRQKKCKPKKISFGRLPKLTPPDCPCIENVPLKEGKPILRLKKRFCVKDPGNICKIDDICATNPRADANLKVVPKTLPVIEAKECPCEEREMTDFVIKRLPKRHVPEPPRICPPTDPCFSYPPRADANLVVKEKTLPKLEPQDCPCIEEEAFKPVTLKRLVPKPVKEPERICIVETCEDVVRADHGLKVKKKSLPQIKGDCQCFEPPPMKEGKPLKKLRKPQYVEPKRVCPPPFVCPERADKDLKFEKRKLPAFMPQDCPCVEPEPPSIDLKLKRLVPRPIKETERICKPPTVCPPRADKGLKVKPKQLPKIEPKECPCVEVEMIDPPPLKRLIPKPVKEPERVCIVEKCEITSRSDHHLKKEKKRLPVLPPGNCPCVEPAIPEDVKPLKKLKKRPVHFVRTCPKIETCPPRADEHLKVKIKKLPKLEVPDCPCLEAPPQHDVKPLRRLKKKHVPEPERICKSDNICDEIPRADADDWLYWKRVEVKSAECEPVKGSKRSFSTISGGSRRYHSTSASLDRNMKYDMSCLLPGLLEEAGARPRNFLECRSTRSRFEPIDCVAFTIYKNNMSINGNLVKEGLNDASFVFNSGTRFISTCSTLFEYSERVKSRQEHQAPSCECPPTDDYLQPQNPIIPEREMFVKPYPPDDEIEDSIRKSRLYERTYPPEEKRQVVTKSKDETLEVLCGESKSPKPTKEVKLGLWQRVLNFFKAKDCPPPEEFKRMRLKEEAERAASKAGLCLYDPKELLKRDKDAMPKVITADTAREEISK